MVAGKMLVGPQVGIGGCSSLVEDDLVSRACDWLLVIFVFRLCEEINIGGLIQKFRGRGKRC